MTKTYNSYKTIGEVVKILNLKSKKSNSKATHTIRFWESRISKLKVLRTHSGHRLYNYENLLLLKKIKELVDVQKLTLDGVNEYFSNSKVKKNTLNDYINIKLIVYKWRTKN